MDSPPVQAIAAAARDLVEKRDNWLNPPGASAAELKKDFPGIGKEKAKLLKAALEIGRRLVQENVGERPRIASPEEAAAVLRERARSLDREVFWVLLLDTKNRLMAPPAEVSKGTLSSSLVHPREIFKPAIQLSILISSKYIR